MKKFYFLLCAVFFYGTTTIYAQQNGFTNNSADYKWSTSTNWQDNTLPVAANRCKFPAAKGHINVDMNATVKRINNRVTDEGNFFFGNTVGSDKDYGSSGTTTLDINSTNTTDAENEVGNFAILNQSEKVGTDPGGQTNFSIDSHIIINNTGTPEPADGPARSIIKIKGDTGNKIVFRRMSTLTLTTEASFHGASASNIFNFNGTLLGSGTLNIGPGTTTFGQVADISSWAGNYALLDGANVTVDNGSFFKDGSQGGNINVGGSTSIATLNLDQADAITNCPEFIIKNTNTLNLNVGADQTELGHLEFKSGSSNGTLNIDAGSNIAEFCGVDDSFDVFPGTGIFFGTPPSIDITNFVPGTIGFGTGLSANAITNLLAIITSDAGEALRIDFYGFLQLASTLGVENHNAFEFTVYPNPAKEVLTINTQQQLQKVEIADLLGRTVLTQQNVSKSVDVSLLSKGVYIIKLTSEKGISTKKIIKE